MSRPLLALLVAASAARADGPVILSMDELRHAPPKEKGTAELVEGKVGKAVRFAFEAGAKSAFFTTNARGTPDWDRAAGFSFSVRGYGTDGFGGLQFIHGDDYAARYDLCFPVRGTEWTKVTVAWRDLAPVTAKAELLSPTGAFRPSKLAGPWVGKWWYWRDYPAVTFALDDIRLESSVPADRSDAPPAGDPLARVRAKLRAGKPVTVVTLGDSLTDTRHWANRQTVWPDLVRDRIKGRFGSAVTVVNPAIGGTELKQNLALIPTWSTATPRPDLVTVLFGGNDWNSGVRGEAFAAACRDAVDRVRRATGGSADVLLMTTVPAADRWDTYAELEAAAKRAAADRNAGLVDAAAAVRAAGAGDHAKPFAWDKVHLGPAGHAAVADAVLEALR
jgi:lysophospholipase L1-like esterase